MKSLCLAAMLAACATTSYSTATQTADVPYGEAGTVVSVRQSTRRVEGQPAAGAAAGGLIGGLVTGHWFGAVAGGATGAILSSGRSETTVAEVTVRFDDGQTGTFQYRDYTVLRPGQRVQLTPDGPVPAG